MNIIKVSTNRLPCQLDDTEVLSTAKELADAIQETAAEEEAQKNLKDQMKAKLSELVARTTRLAIVVATRQEYRDVEVTTQYQADGQVQEVRGDTGEIILVRPPREDERQTRLEG